MDTKVFEAYSQYYDLLYKDKDYDTESEYIDTLIKQFSNVTTNILELGCGTGIHASKLASKGYRIEGIDKSETMLRRALELKEKLSLPISEKLSFLEGDIRNYKSALKFDTVISLFHVMSYMNSNDDLNQAFKTAQKHLKPNGIFIFDCWHGPGVLNDQPVSRTKSFENEQVSITRTSFPNILPKANIVDVDFDIQIFNKKNNETIKLNELHTMRYLFLEEIKSISEINGLEIIHAEEWLTKNQLTENSWNACYVCRNKF